MSSRDTFTHSGSSSTLMYHQTF